MPRHARGKSLSSKARRLRKLKSNAAKAIILTEPIAYRKKRRKKEEHAYPSGESVPVPGRVIVSLACVLQIANAAVIHAEGCKSKYKGVKLLNGSIEVDCDKCRCTLKVPTDLGITHCSYNKALTLAAFTSGTGLEAINTILATLSVPEISFAKFQKEEETLFSEMYEAMQTEFEDNAKEEYRLAMDEDHYIVDNGQRIPYITVVVDGGWNKRSFGHRYDSNAGVAVIIGQRTKKILFMDWRIKTCAKCSSDDRLGKTEPHQCFKNWTDSAQSMEADIIVEGFKLSLAKHGLLYRYMVGDADSSVFYRVKAAIHYPVEIEKIDCVNHGMRCTTTKLHAAAANTMFAKSERDLLKSKISQMARDTKGAINYNHEQSLNNSTIVPPAKSLYEDLVNIPSHVFGDHLKCKAYFCKNAGKKEAHPIMKSRIFTAVQNAFSQLAHRSGRLIHNVTSNLAEGFMSQMCKFTSGKRCNQTQRYGYPLRAMSAVFSFDNGPFWIGAIYKRLHQNICSIWSERHAKALEYRHRIRPKRITKYLKPRKRKVVLDYGPNAPDVDIDTSLLQASVESLIASLQVTRDERNRIQLATIGQAFNSEWRYQRRQRLTASLCAKIFKMRHTTNSSKCIQSILYPIDLSSNENVRRGIDLEPFARKKYETVWGEIVTDCGLFISLENGCLAASPDGLIGENGLLEIKCPNTRPKELCVRKDRILVLDKDDPSKMHLNRKHPYYYQVIMQLYVTGREFCDFVVYYAGDTPSNDEIWKERICRSAETDMLWEEMKERLIKFFREDVAPEIVQPRYTQGLPIRQPKYRQEALDQAKVRKETTQSTKKSRVEDVILDFC